MDVREFSKMAFKPLNPTTPRRGGPAPPTHGGWFRQLEDDGAAVVFATLVAVVLSTVFAVRFLTPLLHTLAVFPFFYSAQRRCEPAWAATILVRWILALFIGTMAIGAFTPDRVIASVPFGEGVVAAVTAWVSSGASAPIDWAYLLWGIVGFFALSLVSGGLLGIALTSVALATTAAGALFFFRSGFNVLQMSLVAVPIWQWCLFAAVPFLLTPTSAVFYQRALGIDRDSDSLVVSRLQLYLGAGLLASSLVLRLVLPGPWRDLLSRWTTL